MTLVSFAVTFLLSWISFSLFYEWLLNRELTACHAYMEQELAAVKKLHDEARNDTIRRYEEVIARVENNNTRK